MVTEIRVVLWSGGKHVAVWRATSIPSFHGGYWQFDTEADGKPLTVKVTGTVTVETRAFNPNEATVY